MKKVHFAVAGLAVLALSLSAPAPAIAAVADDVLAQYVVIHGALVKGSTESVAAAAARIAELVGPCAAKSGAASECAKLVRAAQELRGADVESLRGKFAPFSVAADAYLRAARAEGWSLYYCPMVDSYWIQTKDAVENPYDPKMLRCGSKVEKVSAG